MQQQLDTKDAAERIRAFLAENFLLSKEGFTFSDDASFLDEGIVDSTGVLELTMFIEQTFDITINDEEILPENFDSVNRIVAFIERKAG